MHPFGPNNIGCADCHGGNFSVTRPEGSNRGDKAFDEAKKQAHVQPKNPKWFERDGGVTVGTSGMSLEARPLSGALRERDLVASCRTGDAEAFARLVQLHEAMVVNLAGRLLGNVEEARDVAQEVFVKLLQASKTETRPIAWEPWLTRVTLNACRDRRRSGWWKWRRAPRPSAGAEDLSVLDHPSPEPTPEEEALSREARRRIWQAFRELPSRQQEVFALRYVEGWSTEAVADALGLNTGSVKQHLFRAVHRLRAVIGGEA